MTDPKFKWKMYGEYACMSIDNFTFRVECLGGHFFCYIKRMYDDRKLEKSFNEAGAALRFCEDEYNRITSAQARNRARHSEGIQNLTEAVKGSQYKEL